MKNMRIINNKRHANNCGCKLCVLPGAYQFAQLDQDKTCKFCRTFEEKTFLGKERLLQDLDLQPDEKLGITVSGGKDSIYMWGVLTELLGPDRVVAFSYYRPGVSNEIALKNVKKTKEILGTDLVVYTDVTAYERFRKNFEILLKNPKPEAVRVLLCAGCRYGITGQMYEEGRKIGVKKYLSGASYLELAPFKEELMAFRSEKGDLDEGFEKIVADYPELDYGTNLKIINRDQHYKYKNNDTMCNQIHVGSDIKLFDFDNYFENDPCRIEKIVKQKYDWKKTERSWHFDCIVEDIKDVFYYGLLGYTEMDFKLSAMVRHGLLTRKEAEKILQEERYKIANSFPRMVNTLKEHHMEYLQPELERLYRESAYLKYKENSLCG